MQTAKRETNIERSLDHVLPESGTFYVGDGLRQGRSSLQNRSLLARLPTELLFAQNTMLLPSEYNRIPLPVYEGIKRALDLLAVFLAVLFLSPIAVCIALLIWCEDRGPVLYSQDRIGRDGKPFRFYKFRSMVPNADRIRLQLDAQNEAVGPIFKIKEDPRITRVGRVLRKYSLDELPQFFNVLYGHMSLVGPRPHLPREVACYTEKHQKRLAVRPGLICLREVCGRSRLSFDEWIALDLIYVQHRNLLLDGWILLRAIPAVLSTDGAY